MNAGERGARPFALAALAAGSVFVLLALATWHGLANGSRVGSPWMSIDGQHLLFRGAVQGGVVLASLGLDIAAALIGYAFVVRPLFRDLATWPWRFVAGFAPGVLLIIPVSRLTSLVLPNTMAPGVVWAMIVAGAGVALWRLRPRARSSIKPPVDWRMWGVFAAAVAGTLVFSVFIDRMHVMGSASHDFTRDIYLAGPYALGSSGHFPLISQHYDEPAFLYPLVYGLLKPDATADGTLTAVYWFLLALGRLSVASLTFISLRAFRIDGLSALVLTGFVFAASLALNPAASNLMFDSLSPLANTLHMARILAPVAPLIFLAASTRLEGRVSTGGLLVAVLIGAGLSSMTISVSVVYLWAAAVLVLTAISPSAGGSTTLWKGAAAAGVLVLAAVAFAYGLQGWPAPPRALALAGSSVAGGALLAAILVMLWARGGDGQRLRLSAVWWASSIRETGPMRALQAMGPSLPYWIACAAGYGLGLAFMGNMLVYAFQGNLGPLWPWQDAGIWNRSYGALATEGLRIVQSPYCAAGETWGHRIITNHCGSLPMFARTYGLSMVAVVMVCGWMLTGRKRAVGLPDRTTTMLFWGLMLCLLAQPIGFTILDFVSSGTIEEDWARHLSMWLRVRLLESFFYGGVLIAGVVFFRTADDRARRWAQSGLLAATALYLFNPLTIPAQMVANAAYLVETLLVR